MKLLTRLRVRLLARQLRFLVAPVRVQLQAEFATFIALARGSETVMCTPDFL